MIYTFCMQSVTSYLYRNNSIWVGRWWLWYFKLTVTVKPAYNLISTMRQILCQKRQCMLMIEAEKYCINGTTVLHWKNSLSITALHMGEASNNLLLKSYTNLVCELIFCMISTNNQWFNMFCQQKTHCYRKIKNSMNICMIVLNLE